MNELVGRIASLDAEASEALKAVSFFDALITNGAGMEALVRGAAVLAGVVVGTERNGRTTRFDPTGRRVEGGEGTRRSSQRTFGAGTVWLERDGAAFANDAVIVERLGFAIGLLDTRAVGPSGLAIAIDSSRSLDERVPALPRLRLEPSTRIRLIATDADAARIGRAATVMPTRYGLMQAGLDLDGTFEPPVRAGLGPWVRADHAPESWESAVLAYRLTTSLTPIVDAATLGAMMILMRAYDPETPHEDVVALRNLDTQSAQVLRVLVESESVRSAASELGMHHSTLHAKHEGLIRVLGYDPRSTVGRMRYIAAEVLRRVSDGV